MSLDLADFTPAERECISRKTRKLIEDEGRPQDQAVAIAISTCAPSKSNRADSSDLRELSRGFHFDATLPIGRRYMADWDPVSKSWTIRDVPIMAVVPKGAKFNRQEVSWDWMRGALKANRAQRESGYLPPVHLEHHDDGVSVQSNRRIGLLRITRIGAAPLPGKVQPGLFADIVGVKEDDLPLFESGDYPYVSIEVPTWERTEIASLAVMNNEASFFKFPLLTVTRSRTGAETEFERFSSGPVIAVAYTGHGSPGAILFRHGGPRMNLSERIRSLLAKLPDDVPRCKEQLEKARVALADNDEAMAVELVEQVEAALQEEEKKKKDEETAAKAKAKAKASVHGPDDKPGDVQGQMLKLLGAIANKLGLKDDDETHGPKAPAEDNNKKMSDREARLEGRLAALEDNNQKRTRGDLAQSLVTAKLSELKTDGYNFNEESMESRCIQLLDGLPEDADEEALVAQLSNFTDGYKENMAKDPPTTVEELAAQLRSGGEDDVTLTESTEEGKFLTKLRAASPERFAEATKMFREWESWREDFGSDVSFESYYESQQAVVV